MASYKTKHRLNIQSSDYVPWYFPKGVGNLCQNKSLHKMFAEALFKISKPWKKPRCLLVGESVVVVQLLSHVWLCNSMDCSVPSFLYITIFQSLLKLMSIESVMPSNHLILCHPLLLPSIFPSNQALFQWVSSLHQVAKVLELHLQRQSFQWIFRTDFL